MKTDRENATFVLISIFVFWEIFAWRLENSAEMFELFHGRAVGCGSGNEQVRTHNPKQVHEAYEPTWLVFSYNSVKLSLNELKFCM